MRSAAVGTVFAEGDLTPFYDSTSFTPFLALSDGRQSWKDLAEEISKVVPVYLASLVVGTAIELALVRAL